ARSTAAARASSSANGAPGIETVSTSSGPSSKAYARLATPLAGSKSQRTKRNVRIASRSKVQSVIDRVLCRQCPQVVGVGHGHAVGAGIGHQQDVALGGVGRQLARTPEYVAGFADRSDNVEGRHG